MDRIHQLIEDKPDADLAILDFDETQITYGELRHHSADLADLLAAHGVRSGDRLVLVAENCALYGAAIFAASQLNAWITLVNARQSATELDAVLAHSGARCAIFTTVVSAAALDHADRMGAVSLGTIGRHPVRVSPVRNVQVEPVKPNASQVAALLYTTGTTSAPKGVMLTHDNLIFNAQGSQSISKQQPGDQVLAVLPGTHVYGFASLFLPTMRGGASVRFVPRFDPVQTIHHLRHGITHYPAVPQMLAAIIAHLHAVGESPDCPRLRLLATGGAPLDPNLKTRVQDMFGLPLNNGYGLTETAPTVSVTRSASPRGDCAVGDPLSDVDVRVDQPNAEGIGELQVRGRNIMAGYYRDPARTAEVMTDDDYFRTGDLARIGPDGALHIVGRLKELIIRSGFNIYPPEIEAMLTRHNDVYQAAVIGRHVPGNEEVLAFVITNGNVTEATICAWLKEQLAAYKIPQHILIVDAYPVAATGKILKHKLVAHFADLLAERDAMASA
ncbi:class I adenylate-forming enzyme family protein [Actibacterium sp. 188UL27-1]|uniref:class I adenylate-forming enzyme family protein n=1 Tax=Actibacterium sp. 188UL27-1 TaxID=2786961 RepID=UPI0019585854|nr:AMP-binding protein [Actibacterium sp. 188UL27-1]MBM7069648.1 AMP-binding protein [Actibacterium sp. 188UL27-1]